MCRVCQGLFGKGILGLQDLTQNPLVRLETVCPSCIAHLVRPSRESGTGLAANTIASSRPRTLQIGAWQACAAHL